MPNDSIVVRHNFSRTNGLFEITKPSPKHHKELSQETSISSYQSLMCLSHMQFVSLEQRMVNSGFARKYH